ncbi:MAG: BA14K family protein [Phenylobacterium sp.]|uniref:BA14K family protein n=1 Tax=Phenylobacterium sp. TaxID=1871053 RepID=UPI00391A4032
MRRSIALVMASVASLVAATPGLAQPRPYVDAWGGRPPPRDGAHYYYDGRWVDHDEWRRHEAERERWARAYHRRRPDRRDDDGSAALVAGIIGFALGAAIVGSMEQAEHARTADESWDDYCRRKYRSYDPRSRTYLGYDGLRHYCR